jgi:hypothetical protein
MAKRYVGFDLLRVNVTPNLGAFEQQGLREWSDLPPIIIVVSMVV